jgi:hypothetical protein
MRGDDGQQEASAKAAAHGETAIRYKQLTAPPPALTCTDGDREAVLRLTEYWDCQK